MRFLLFLFGVVVGAGGAVAYMLFAADQPIEARPPSALPANPPFSVTLSESLVTDLLQRGALKAPGVSVPKGALRAELQTGTITVHADVDVGGQPTHGTAVVRPVVNAGQLQVDVVEANLGILPLPALRTVLDDQVNPRLQQIFRLLPVTVSGVQVTPAGLTVACQINLDGLTPMAMPGLPAVPGVP